MTKPSLYKDIGKKADDLLNDDFDLGTKLEVKSTAANGTVFTFTGKKAAPSSAIIATLALKHKKNGVAVNTKVDTSGKLSADVSHSDLADGLKIELKGNTGSNKSGRVGFEYIHEHLAVNGGVDVYGGPTVDGAAVLGYEGFSFGYETQYDAQEGAIKKSNSALSYSSNGYTVAGHAIQGGSTLKASYIHDVNSTMTVAGEYKQSSESKVVTAGISYKVDKDTNAKAKIDSTGRVGLSYSQAVKPSVTFVGALEVDTTRLDKPENMRVGLQVLVSENSA